MKTYILTGLAIFLNFSSFAHEDSDNIYQLFPSYYQAIDRDHLINMYREFGPNPFAILGYTPFQDSMLDSAPAPLWTIQNGEPSSQESLHLAPSLDLELLLAHQPLEWISLTYNENPTNFPIFIPLLQLLGLWGLEDESIDNGIIAQKYDTLNKPEQVSLIITLLRLSAQIKDVDSFITLETAFIQSSPTKWNFLLNRALRSFEPFSELSFKSFGRTVYGLSLLKKKECLAVARIAKSLCRQFDHRNPLSQSLVLYYLCRFSPTSRVIVMNFLKLLGEHDQCNCNLNTFLLYLHKKPWEQEAAKMAFITDNLCTQSVTHLDSIVTVFERLARVQKDQWPVVVMEELL
jgi:hypothetical protein